MYMDNIYMFTYIYVCYALHVHIMIHTDDSDHCH